MCDDIYCMMAAVIDLQAAISNVQAAATDVHVTATNVHTAATDKQATVRDVQAAALYVQPAEPDLQCRLQYQMYRLKLHIRMLQPHMYTLYNCAGPAADVQAGVTNVQ